jgi:hypothetical protein
MRSDPSSEISIRGGRGRVRRSFFIRLISSTYEEILHEEMGFHRPERRSVEEILPIEYLFKYSSLTP